MKKIFLFVLAAATLLACNKAEVPTRVNDEARVVKFQVNNLYSFGTKAAINAGSSVAVYASAPINASNVAYTVATMPTAEPANGTLSGTTIEWGIEQIGTTTPSTFFAMYPHAVSDERNAFNTTTPLPYTIDNEEYAKDFLVAVTEQNPGTNAEHPNSVTFNFQHPFALLRYVITNSTDDAIRYVKIANVHKTGDLAYATAAITATGEAVTAAELALESSVNNVNTYYSVIVPEASINPAITITMWSGATFSFQLSAAQAFAAGNQYTASLTISSSHAATTSNRTMTAGFTVAEWTSNNVSATAPVYTGASFWPFVRGENFGTGWDDGLPMTCVGENSYRKVITIAATGTTTKLKVVEENLSTHAITWYGSSASSTVDGWTKHETGGYDIYLDNVTAGDLYTIYYYSDGHEIWIKSGDVTR